MSARSSEGPRPVPPLHAAAAFPRDYASGRAVRAVGVAFTTFATFAAHAACAACAAIGFCAVAMAHEVAWNGTHYLPVPVRLGSDTRLVMPEECDDAWERDADVAVSSLDATTLIIRPRTATIEQRLTLHGRRTGTLYLARVSSALPYTPLVVVRAIQPAAPAQGAGGASSSANVVGLLRAMMLGTAPAGLRIERSARVLLDQPPYRIVARELWRSGTVSGIVAELTSTLQGRALQVVPANLVIRIPELGALRAAAPERYEIPPEAPATRLFLVYAR